MRTGDKQSVLEELNPVRRLNKLCRTLRREVEILELEQEMRGKVREQITRNQRDYVLREQLKVLQQELGEDPNGDGEIFEYRQKIAQAKLPKPVEEKLLKELGRLEKQPYGSAEAGVLRNYLDVCLELPWEKRPESGWTWPPPVRSWTPTIMAWKRSRNAFWSFWRSSSWPRI